MCESALFGNKGFSFVFCKWEVTVVVECNSTIVLDCCFVELARETIQMGTSSVGCM